MSWHKYGYDIEVITSTEGNRAYQALITVESEETFREVEDKFVLFLETNLV